MNGCAGQHRGRRLQSSTCTARGTGAGVEPLSPLQAPHLPVPHRAKGPQQDSPLHPARVCHTAELGGAPYSVSISYLHRLMSCWASIGPSSATKAAVKTPWDGFYCLVYFFAHMDHIAWALLGLRGHQQPGGCVQDQGGASDIIELVRGRWHFQRQRRAMGDPSLWRRTYAPLMTRMSSSPALARHDIITRPTAFVTPLRSCCSALLRVELSLHHDRVSGRR